MKIGIALHPSHKGRTARSLGLALQAAGAEVVFFGLEDLKDLGSAGLDLFVDIDARCAPAVRRAAGCRCVVLFRGTADFEFLEKANYLTREREYTLEGVDEVWLWDLLNSEASVASLQTLFGDLPVRRVPFVWAPPAAEAPALQQTAAAAPLRIVIGEANQSSATNCIVPLTGVGRWLQSAAAAAAANIQEICLLNAAELEGCRYFQRNIVENVKKNTGHIPIRYLGPTAYSELQSATATPLVITHLRFKAARAGLFELAWLGIPFVHNSRFLQEAGFAANYYEGNSLEGMGVAAQQELAAAAASGWQQEAARRRQWAETVCSPAAAAAGWRTLLQQPPAARAVLQRPFTTLPRQQAVSIPTSPTFKSTHRIVRIGFCDMWEGFAAEDNWFLDVLNNTAGFLGEKGTRIIGVDGKEEDCDLLVFGPFGNSWESIDSSVPKVFFSGERVDTTMLHDSRVSLFLTHSPVEDDKHMRVPLWLMFLNWFTPQPHLQRNPNSLPWRWAIERDSGGEGEETKRDFCAFVVSNPTNQVRNAAFETVHSYKPVHSGGAYKNNIGGPIHHLYGGGGGGDVAKHTFLKKHTFCICYENSLAPGYVTEKLLHAKLAGCVPLYWGAAEAGADFDPSGFVNFNGKESDLLRVVQQLEANPAELQRMAAAPALDAGRLEAARKTVFRVGERLLQLAGLLQQAPAAAVNTIHLPPTAAAAPAPPAAPAAQQPPAAPLQPLYVTFATKCYLPYLEQALCAWKALSTSKTIVYLGHDVLDADISALQRVHNFAEYRRLPAESPVAGFPDFWEPKMFGWKVWILKTLCEEAALANRLILYSDAGAMWVRLPTEMLTIANEKGVCVLTDKEQINRHWCSPEMVSAMNIREDELAQQQLIGSFQAFVAGHPIALRFYREAFAWASKRECLFGPFSAGTDASGNPIGHRHDQSIYSILTLRQKIPSILGNPLINTISLRKTYQTAAAVYLHRGDYLRHRQPLPGVDDVWVISLDRRADRWASWKAAHPQMAPLANRLCAIDGKALQLTPALQALFQGNDFHWKKSVVGCALSHILLWCQLVSEHPEIQNYLIFEDDHRFKDPAWPAKFAAAMQQAPPDAELLYFGGVLPGNKAAYRECIEPVNDIWAMIRPNNLFTGENGAVVPLFHFCTYSYLLTRKGAEKLLAVLRTKGCQTSIDHFLGWPAFGLKKYVMRDLLATCFQEEDPIYVNSQFDDMKRVDAFDSDIWNNNQCFEVAAPAAAAQPPLWKCITDVLEQAPANIQTHRTLREKAVNGVVPIKPMQVFCYGDLKEGAGDGALEQPWLKSLYPGFTRQPFSLQAVLASPDPWLLFARPHIDFWNSVVAELEKHKKGFSILHLSDEGCLDNITAYNSPLCKKVIRNYVRPGLNAKVRVLPLGPAAAAPPAAAAAATHDLVWTFHGTRWFDRPQQLAALQRAELQPYSLKFQDDFLDASMTPMAEYSGLLQRTQFVPVPRGNNCETFRVYEALEHGCIPLYVRTPGDADYWAWLTEHLELVELRDWEAAVNLMVHLRANPAKAEMYRQGLCRQWNLWKVECGQYV